MFGIKTKFKKKFTDFLLKKTKSKKILTDPITKIDMYFSLLGLKIQLNNNKKANNLDLATVPHSNKFSQLVWKALINRNPNNLGQWIGSKEKLTATKKVEQTVLQQILNFFKVKNTSAYDGYVSSGSTEGNIFALWSGREHFSKLGIPKEKVALIKNSLTHYSVQKAANITGISSFTSPILLKEMRFSPNEIEKSVEKLYKKGFRGFFIPLTIGYTVSGTSDPLEEIFTKLKKLEGKFKKIKFFVWLDAAMGGLILPFSSNQNFKPFNNKFVQLITIDFHKFLRVPYPAGVILYKKNLTKGIIQEIPYIDQQDTTLLGSRPGISSVAIWATLQGYGEKGLIKLVKNSIERKNKFLLKVKSDDSKENLKIISDPHSIQAMIISPNNQGLPAQTISNNHLVLREQKIETPNGTKKVKYYKVFFLPKS